MKNSKLIHLLKKLNLSELKQLRLFLQSPYFVTKNSKELKLFNYLLEQYPDFPEKAIEKEGVFKHLFSERTYKPLKMYQLMSSLAKLIDDFLVYQTMKADDQETQIRRALLLYENYQRFGIEKWMRAQEKKLDTLQKQNPFRSTDYYYHQYQIISKIGKFSSYANDRRSNIPILDIFNNYNIYFCSNLMSLLCMHYTDQQIFQAIDALPSIEEIDVLLNLLNVQEIPNIKVYRQAIRMFQTTSEQSYQDFKSLLHQHLQLFPMDEARNLLIYAQNFAQSQIRQGKTNYRQEYFDLYQLGLKNKILYYDGKIPRPHLKNIISISLLLEKYDWAKAFLEAHRYLIWGKDSKEVYQFNLAQIAFAQSDYDTALSLISHQHFEDLFYELTARRMELKIMYELQEILVLEPKLHAFKMYIHRNKVLSKHLKTHNNNFIKILSRLTRTIPKEPKQLEKLENALQKMTKQVVDERWLWEKVEDLR